MKNLNKDINFNKNVNRDQLIELIIYMLKIIKQQRREIKANRMIIGLLRKKPKSM